MTYGGKGVLRQTYNILHYFTLFRKTAQKFVKYKTFANQTSQI
jgi:hypothetical protein